MEPLQIEYVKMDQSPAKPNRTLILVLMVTCILLLGVTIFCVSWITSHQDDDSSTSTIEDIEYCTKPGCLSLADDLANSLNYSVDPCEDFYNFVCDGWIDSKSWEETMVSDYNQFEEIALMERDTFLDSLFYDTKKSLVNFTSVHKTEIYFKTCYKSDSVDSETIEGNEFLSALIEKMDFVGNNTDAEWDDDLIDKFHESLTHLIKLDFPTIFDMEVATLHSVYFMQLIDFWSSFQDYNVSYYFKKLFAPLYESSYYSYSNPQDDAGTMSIIQNSLEDFSYSIYAISTVDDSRYGDYTQFMNMLKVINFTDLATTFNETKYMNYSKLIMDAYNATADDIHSVMYFEAGIPFFTAFGQLIEQTSPFTVQIYLITSVMFYYLNFEESFTQSRYISRRDFCFYRTMNEFPFVYGYILYNELYDKNMKNNITKFVTNLKDFGLKELINNATWLDEESRSNALDKIVEMDLYIGMPPLIKNGKYVDDYYKEAQQSSSLTWIENLELLATFNYELGYELFWAKKFPITEPWPSDFASPSSYPGWLTGINAFYSAQSNFFTIPLTISQMPFYHIDWPSSVIYGCLGTISGHEMSHGFDPNGAQYDGDGDYVGSIFSNYSLDLYQDKMQCFIQQYDELIVDVLKNKNIIYDNGTQTVTENVADNAGLEISYISWKHAIATNGNDKLLYGIDLNQEQLFFVSWATTWCETSRRSYYANWTDVHSPNKARVIGSLQNSKYFANAFECKSGSKMNPTNKCVLW